MFSKQFNTSRFLFTIGNPTNYFHIYFPQLVDGSCGNYAKPSSLALTQGCYMATNGGPFTMNLPPGSSTCNGYAISDGYTGSFQETTYANFGLLANNSFVIGTLTSTDVKNFDFKQLLTGFKW
jgi:hypothetical protein